MATNKTKATEESVSGFINAVENERKRNDAFEILRMMETLSGFPAKMWGPSIIGFGSYHYKYESGHEGDAPRLGFSPRKANIVLYLATNFENRDGLLAKLGKHRTSVACIYINKLSDIDKEVLAEMITNSMRYMEERYP